MTLTEDIIVRYKGLTLRFKKGSVIETKNGATYVLPPEKKKAKDEE